MYGVEEGEVSLNQLPLKANNMGRLRLGPGYFCEKGVSVTEVHGFEITL